MLGRLLRQDAPEERAVSMAQLGALFGNTYNFGYSPAAVTTSSTLGHSASFACIDVLATSVSILPVDVVRTGSKYQTKVSPTPAVIAMPSALVEQDVWLYQLVESMCTDGNAFGLIVATDQMARPTQIELLDPTSVQQREVVKGVPQAAIDGRTHKLYPYGDLWHVPGKMVRAGTPFADSPIERAAATIGAGIAARDFGSRFFGDGAHPSAIIKAEQDLTPEQARAVKQSFLNATRGNREPAVMGSGLSYEAVSINPSESQFIELMQFVIEETCRFWRVPPSMVYAATSGQNVTYANVAQADLAYLKHSLDGYLVRIERALSKLLARPQLVKFNRNALLRTDAETRGNYLDQRLRNKTLSINEYHAIEDEEPVNDPAFDLPGIPGDDDPPTLETP